MKKEKILVIGACGQVGTELTPALVKRYGYEQVIAADKYLHCSTDMNYIELDVLDRKRLIGVIKEHGITQVYLLAAILSAKGQTNASETWKLNVEGLLSVLEAAKECKLNKVFWPSSIAVFGQGAAKHNCSQNEVLDPQTVYGKSKKAGEYWCNYYFERYGVDIRSLRYPGLISYSAQPGGGITDYAVDIYHSAVAGQEYACYLEEDTCLPMMYMPDAIRATFELMDAPKEKIKVHTSYNLAGMSFSPCDLAAEIKAKLPGFKINYKPDHRQGIAKSWPCSIDDAPARNDWRWKPGYNLRKMNEDMLEHLTNVEASILANEIA